MGCLLYGERIAQVPIDDRTLAHLQIVILRKLRRGESLSFSWIEPTSAGSGRSTIWLHPGMALRFVFAGSRVPSINQVWLDQLTALSHTDGGLRAIKEPAGNPHTSSQDSQPTLIGRR